MMVLPFLVIYLTRELGYSLSRAGLVFAIYGATAIVAGPASGKLSDRIGALPIMRASLISSGAAVLMLGFARTFPAVVAATVLWAACAEIFRPASLAAIAHSVTNEQRKPAFALNRLAINLGMSIGPALGGFLATISFRAMFVVDAATTLTAGGVLLLANWQTSTGGKPKSEVAPASPGTARGIFADRRFGIFLLASVLTGIVFYQHESSLSLYMVEYLHMSPAFYGTLFTINTLLIVALEVPLNTATARLPNTWSLVAGSVLFAIGFGGLAFLSSSGGIVALAVVWTFGEMTLFPAMSSHLAEIAPVSLRGTYMGAYSMSLSVALTIGPWLGNQLLASKGAVGLWSVMFVLAVLGASLMVYAAPAHSRRRVEAAAES
jgi:MFS family permease